MQLKQEDVLFWSHPEKIGAKWRFIPELEWPGKCVTNGFSQRLPIGWFVKTKFEVKRSLNLPDFSAVIYDSTFQCSMLANNPGEGLFEKRLLQWPHKPEGNRHVINWLVTDDLLGSVNIQFIGRE